METFKPRPVSYLGVHPIGDWQFKIYRMAYKESEPVDGLLDATLSNLPKWLDDNTKLNDFDHYKVGTVIIHEAKDSILTVVSWWVYENVIQNHVYCAPFDNPIEAVDYSNKGIRFCVWELNILWHERNLWVEHVLKNADSPDWEKYLANHFESKSAS